MAIKNDKLIVYPEMVRLTMKIAGKLFFGFEFSDKDLNAIVEITAASMWPIHLEIPFSPYHKGMEARRYLTKRYKERIKENRRNPGDDMFSQMCVAKSESGEMFSDQEIINQMIFLMLASHDTTTSTLTSILFETAKDSSWQEKMRTESIEFYEKGGLEYGRLKEFKTLGLVMNETLRLHPALVVMPRYVEKDFSFLGHQIPKGSRVAISTYATHIMPEIYPNPFLFDPNRFTEERAEHKKVPFSFIPFGAGKHICIGQYFAEMEIKIIISQFVRRFKWSIPKGYEIKYKPPLNAPTDGFPVRIERI
ncbi:MAG: cytochrome P450 [Bacteroidetes bacterium]|nr:cytochrome P450 [Bacteroidota bacterium]